MEQKEAIELIFYPLINLIYIYSFISFFNQYYPSKSKKLRRYYPIAVIISYLIIEIPALFTDNSQLILIMNLVSIFTLALFYQSKMLSKCLTTVSLYILSFAVESLWLCLYSVISGIPMQQIGNYTYTVIFLAAISRITYLALIKFPPPIFNTAKKEQKVRIIFRFWIFIFMIPLASILVIYILFKNMTQAKESFSVIIGISLILLINFCVSFLYDCLLKEKAIQQEIILLTKQNEILEQHFRENAELSEAVKKFRHEIKHIMLAILSEVEAYPTNCKEKIQEHFETILGNVEWDAGPSKSGLAGIDVVINYKANIAKQFEVLFETNIKLPPEYTIDNRPVAIILGNALDNAIEACKGLSIEKRIVNIFITQHLENLFISVSNPYQGEILFGEDELPKTKKAQAGHGIGMKSMQTAVAEHGGYFRYDTCNQIFKIEVLLFC